MRVVVALGDIRWCVAARPLLTSVWWSSCRCCGCPADSIQPAQLYLQQMFPGGLPHSSCSTCGAKLPSTSQHWNTQRTSRLDHMVHCMWEKPGYTCDIVQYWTFSAGTWSRTELWGSFSEEMQQWRWRLQNLKQATHVYSVWVTQHGLKYVDTFSTSQIWINKM